MATVQAGIQYAESVLAGEIVAGELVRLACQRFLNDLEHGPERGIYFSEDRAQHILDFYNFVPHVKGALAGKPIELMPWHIFILINLFGFTIPLIDEMSGKQIMDDDGDPVMVRRFRTAYNEVARKNAKSTVSSGIRSSLEGNKRISVPVKAALTTVDVPGQIVAPQRLPGIDTAPKQRLFIRDLIAPGRTQSNTIYYVQQTGFTNKASVVPENTTKPYSEIEFAEKTTAVRTIAHMFKASKQILDDFAQLQSTVDAEMRYGLSYVEEQEILFGDGTGAHLAGIIPQAKPFSAAFAVQNETGIDILRLAMLQAQLARFPASGHVLHFTDWAKIELSKDTLGRYILANPSQLTTPTLWGLPVVATEAAQFLGKFLTGAFNSGAQIFDREEANVVVSSENADDFEKNMITIRCEERLALAVYRPEAFVYGSLTGSGS
jgi:HK97 family phage major capsid protein